MALTKEENGNLKDKVGMIKRKCSVCCFSLGIQVNNSQRCSTVFQVFCSILLYPGWLAKSQYQFQFEVLTKKRKRKKTSKTHRIVFLSRGVKADDKKGGGGARNCRTVKDDTRYIIYLCPSQSIFFCGLPQSIIFICFMSILSFISIAFYYCHN